MGDTACEEGSVTKDWVLAPASQRGLVDGTISHLFPGRKTRMVSDPLDQPECSVSPGRNRRFSQVPQKATPAGPKLISGLSFRSKNEGVQRLNSFTSWLEARSTERQVCSVLLAVVKEGGSFSLKSVLASIWWEQPCRPRKIQVMFLWNCFLVEFLDNYQPWAFSYFLVLFKTNPARCRWAFVVAAFKRLKKKNRGSRSAPSSRNTWPDI